ncbi:transposable element Tc1 transposase [Trichonephila clavipes]|nr:transposable element Tc1 transposase [Trichonephila clavipes]
MDWPPFSPDLNPIKHAWDVLGRRLAARLHPLGNTQQLKQIMIEEWTLIPQELLANFVLSMEKRCEATIAVLTRVDSCCFKSKFYRKDLIDELKIFGMSSRHHIDDFMRGRIIGKIEGRKITDVAREFDIAHSVVSRLWK